MTRAQGKHREFSLNQSVATLRILLSYFQWYADMPPFNVICTVPQDVKTSSFGSFNNKEDQQLSNESKSGWRKYRDIGRFVLVGETFQDNTADTQDNR